MEIKYKDRRNEGDTVLRQCQLVQLYLLHVIDEICKHEGIPYFLVGGTLLGAMRHKGFIPWDDDLDIGVPKDEYKRFLSAMRKNLPANIILQTPKDCPNTSIPFSKVRDTQSFYCECRPDISTFDPSGIYLDVFPYEDMPEIPCFFQKLIVRAIGSMWQRDVWFRRMSQKGVFIGIPCLIMSACCKIVYCVVRLFLGVTKLIFPKRSVYNLPEMGVEYRFERDDIYPLSSHMFEDGEFPVPHNAESVLNAQYGNWREVPPPEKRPRHARIINCFTPAREFRTHRRP